MAQVNDTAKGATLVSGNSAAVDSGLADWIYHRDKNDQAIRLGEIEDNLSIFTDIPQLARDKYGLTISPDGFIYNYTTGFCAAIVQDAAGFAVVFRGTDVGNGGSTDIMGAAAHWSNPSTHEVDIYDI